MSTFESRLNEILNDKQSGSVTILNELSNLLLKEAQKSNPFHIRLKKLLPEIRSKLGHFAVISHFLTVLEESLLTLSHQTNGNSVLADFINNYLEKWENVNKDIARAAIDHLHPNGKRIMVHSNSSAVVAFFSLLKEEEISATVIQTESRPGNEGVLQARRIAGMGFETTLIVDSAMALMMPQTDLVIFGADRLYPGFFVNKIGTYAMALLAGDFNVPCYVLADSRKTVLNPVQFALSKEPQQPKSEILDAPYRNIHPVNYYFEPVPGNLIKALITEKGAGKFT
jgi:translation initiation factor 2B subunit (eIF-2B alpha/beta/delta family)